MQKISPFPLKTNPDIDLNYGFTMLHFLTVAKDSIPQSVDITTNDLISISSTCFDCPLRCACAHLPCLDSDYSFTSPSGEEVTICSYAFDRLVESKQQYADLFSDIAHEYSEFRCNLLSCRNHSRIEQQQQEQLF